MKDKRIAVVGVSHREDKFGYKIFKTLLEREYHVQGVSVRGGEVLGKTIYKSLTALPEKPEMVMTVVPAQITERVIEECHQLGIHEIWMQPGSDSPEAIKKAEGYGMQVTHSVCFMIKDGLW